MPDADYNVAPTTYQPIIRESRESGGTGTSAGAMGTGAVPSRMTSKTSRGCRQSTRVPRPSRRSPTWREPFKKRRCLIPASSFYEWPKEGKPPKQPYLFELANGSPLAFAGLWDAWKDKEGHWLQSFAIVTTEANELLAWMHPRMPVILSPRDYDRWLDREETEQLPLDLLRPFDAEEMDMHEADPKVGNVRNNGPELLAQSRKGRPRWRAAALRSINDQAYGFTCFASRPRMRFLSKTSWGFFPPPSAQRATCCRLQPVRHGRLMYGDGQLGVGSGGTACEIPAAKLVHRLRNSVVDRVCPHLDLMLDVVGIGHGDDAASGVHERQYRRT